MRRTIRTASDGTSYSFAAWSWQEKRGCRPAKRARRRTGLLIAATAGLLMFALPASAQERTWTGEVSTDWHQSRNWSGDAVPTESATIDRISPNPPAVDGRSASLTGVLTVGRSNQGSLTVQNGGVLSIGQEANIGLDAGSRGEVTVTGTGSRLDSTSLNVGVSGSGSLLIGAGGGVVAEEVVIASGAGAEGIVSVDGTRASLRVLTGALQIGAAGSGTLVIENGGTVEGTNVSIANQSTLRVATQGTLDSDATQEVTLEVQSGGRLEGSGTIVGETTNNGTVAPGDSIGTLTMDGDYTHAASATFEVEIDPDGNADLLDISGAAALNGGTVSVLLAPGDYAPGTEFPILTAEGGLGDTTFDTLAPNNPDVSLALEYEGNTVLLVVVERTWTISGTIQDATGALLPDVPVSLTGTSDGETTTNGQGAYTFANLAESGTYTVMPSLDGYIFDPQSQSFENLSADVTADFDAAAIELSITGTVINEDDALLEGVTVTLSGDGQAEVLTDADGAFAFDGLAWGKTYTVAATHPDYDVQPGSHAFDPLEDDQQVTFTATQQTAAYTRYFGEGAVGPFFDTTFALFNPGDEETSATLTFAGETGEVVPHPVTIPAGTQTIVDPETLLPEQWVGFATAIEADQVLVTSRTMRWDDRHYGRHESAGVATPQTEWWFTEGATGTFQLFYLLYNPNDQAAEVTATYYRGVDQGVVTRTYTVGPHTRRTVFVNVAADGQTPDPDLGTTQAAAHIVSTNGVPIVAERAMYLTTDAAQPLTAGTLAPGVTEPALSWHFAEGATDFFDLFLLLANPSAERVDATVQYLLPTGEPLTRTYALEPQSRRTIWVDAEDAALAATQVAITVQSETPILAERAMWWGANGPWDGGHVGTGAARPATRWGLAGLTLGGPDTAEAYVLIANPNAAEAAAMLTLVTPDGARAQVSMPLAPWSRTTLRLRDLFPDVGEDAVAVLVESTAGDNPVPLVVEGAAYASPDGRALTTGSATPALPLPE